MGSVRNRNDKTPSRCEQRHDVSQNCCRVANVFENVAQQDYVKLAVLDAGHQREVKVDDVHDVSNCARLSRSAFVDLDANDRVTRINKVFRDMTRGATNLKHSLITTD
jgi:hypothetical protein